MKELKEKANLGDSILNSAIKLSLEYLDSELKKMRDLFPIYSMYEMYISLCVLEKLQCMPVSVLALMWRIEDTCAERIARLFASMSLGRTSRLPIGAMENEPELSIHDLHHDFSKAKRGKRRGIFVC